MITIGSTIEFNCCSTNSDAAWTRHSGEQVKVIRQLGPEEADEEVGPMFEVEASNGERFHVFKDELIATAERIG